MNVVLDKIAQFNLAFHISSASSILFWPSISFPQLYFGFRIYLSLNFILAFHTSPEFILAFHASSSISFWLPKPHPQFHFGFPYLFLTFILLSISTPFTILFWLSIPLLHPHWFVCLAPWGFWRRAESMASGGDNWRSETSSPQHVPPRS